MSRNECGQSRCPGTVTVGKLALTILVVLTLASLASGAPKNDKDVECTRVYQHTYDEVFQATQQTIERQGYFLIDKDQDKGTITSTTPYKHMNFSIHIEVLNNTPETRVTITGNYQGVKSLNAGQREFAKKFLTELQTVLSTYR